MRTPKDEETPASDGREGAGSLGLLEQLLAVHTALDIPWLADAAMTAAQTGLGALYGFLYLGTASGGLCGQEPASPQRAGALVRVSQALGLDPTRLTIDPEGCGAVAEALRDRKVVVTASLASVVPFEQDESKAAKTQQTLGVTEAWVVPLQSNSETLGVCLLMMPEKHAASVDEAALFGRHLAVALVNLREGESARKRGELDAVRWIRDERRLTEELGLELRRSVRHGRPLSVLIVQVSDYAQLRLRYGRFLAERALRRAASAMEDAMRSTDFLGAYGEDGFAAILVEADADAAANARERYLALLGQLDVAPAKLPGLTLDVVCGVATAGAGLSTPQELLLAAHAAAVQPLREAA